jgi:hypothetical protein
MTILDEAKQLRAEVAKLRPDKRRRYPDDLRRRILSWVGRAVAAGQVESECSKAIGVKTWRFTMWRRLEATTPRSDCEPLALVPITVPGMSISSQLSVVSPSGYRVEGLSLEQVATLLRELA